MLQVSVGVEGELIRIPQQLVILVENDKIPSLIDLKSLHITSESEITVTAFSKALYVPQPTFCAMDSFLMFKITFKLITGAILRVGYGGC